MIEDSKLLEDANEIGAFTIQTFLIVLIVGWMFALLFGNSIRLPLSRLRSMMVVNPYVPSSQKYPFKANDEVSQIGEKFLRMMEENRGLNAQVYDALLKRKEAEIQVLQAQINPHFLYNTLESLNGFAVSNNHLEMSEVIGALGKFFRITLSRGNDLITVADEVEHVSAYVRVQQFRFKDKFDWICEVDEEMAQYRVPKLILQPLVENALLHGFGQSLKDGLIDITASTRNSMLYLDVADNGVGMEKAKEKKVARKRKSIGIQNIRESLELIFKNQSTGLTLESTEEGTRVSMHLPLLLSKPYRKEDDIHGSHVEDVDRRG